MPPQPSSRYAAADSPTAGRATAGGAAESSAPTGGVSAAERAYEATKQAIITGELAAGTMTSEILVCQQLGVSRTPVHEAFLRLAAEGLLSLESRKGAVVRPMSPSEARDVLEMRRAVEAAAATRVITEGITAELAQALQALLDTQAEALAAGNTNAFVDADDAFHAAIVSASRNEVAVHFTRFLRSRQQRLRHQLLRVRPEHFGTVLDQHRQLAATLAAGDPRHYRALLTEHIAAHGIAS
jgi:DNA-binding GntR family transcriptional regulator